MRKSLESAGKRRKARAGLPDQALPGARSVANAECDHRDRRFGTAVGADARRPGAGRDLGPHHAKCSIADAGSRDDTPAVADIAGCKLLAADEPLGRRLHAAADAARAPWLLFLQPGIVLDTPLDRGNRAASSSGRVRDFHAAVFRRALPAQSALREAMALLASTVGARLLPEQGLVIAADFYHRTGGHSERAADPESDLLRRIGRRRLARFSTGHPD